MNIQINYAGISQSDSIDRHIHEQIDATIGRFEDRLTRVEIHVRDENGDKPGNNDKRCMIESRPKGRDPLVVESFGDDMYNTISDAAGKMRRVLDSKLNRD